MMSVWIWGLSVSCFLAISAITADPCACTCGLPEMCEAPNDAFIITQSDSQDVSCIDSSGDDGGSHSSPVSGFSFGLIRVENTIYFSTGMPGEDKGVYAIDWCNTTSAVTLLADISSMNPSKYVGDMAYLQSTDKLLVFASFNAWLSVDRITGAYTTFYPTDGSILNYPSYGALVVDDILYWTRQWPAKFFQLDVSDPLNLPTHTEVSPGFSSSEDFRDLTYHNGVIYILDHRANVFAYEPNVGGNPTKVIRGSDANMAKGLTWFDDDHLLITKVNFNEISIVEIGTPDSPTSSSDHELFASVTTPLSILNMADYYTPA